MGTIFLFYPLRGPFQLLYHFSQKGEVDVTNLNNPDLLPDDPSYREIARKKVGNDSVTGA